MCIWLCDGTSPVLDGQQASTLIDDKNKQNSSDVASIYGMYGMYGVLFTKYNSRK